MSYGQFCPVAKASEIFATRWTPLILRELLTGAHTFGNIARGVPLISRAVLVTRLRELERNGIVERRAIAGNAGHGYWLTPAGEDFRAAVDALGIWGTDHSFDHIEDRDLDPALLMTGLAKRALVNDLSKDRIVVRFEFSGVPASRTKFKLMWLVLAETGADVCVKSPGHGVDLILRAQIREWVSVYLGRTTWSDFTRTHLDVDGDMRLVAKLPRWLGLVPAE